MVQIIQNFAILLVVVRFVGSFSPPATGSIIKRTARDRYVIRMAYTCTSWSRRATRRVLWYSMAPTRKLFYFFPTNSVGRQFERLRTTGPVTRALLAHPPHTWSRCLILNLTYTSVIAETQGGIHEIGIKRSETRSYSNTRFASGRLIRR